MLGEKELCSLAPWPQYDEAKTKDDTIEIAIQVCGKLRGTVMVAATATREEMIEAAKADEKIKPFIDSKTIIKEIAVPGKLVNIVVK